MFDVWELWKNSIVKNYAQADRHRHGGHSAIIIIFYKNFEDMPTKYEKKAAKKHLRELTPTNTKCLQGMEGQQPTYTPTLFSNALSKMAIGPTCIIALTFIPANSSFLRSVWRI